MLSAAGNPVPGVALTVSGDGVGDPDLQARCSPSLAPELTTEVSNQQVMTGATVFDRVTIHGLGGLAVSVRVELWGPFATKQAVGCSGTPYKVQTLAVTGDGTYATAPVAVTKAGYCTYRATITAGPLNDAVTAACGESDETALAG